MGHFSSYPNYNSHSRVGLDALLVLEIIQKLLKSSTKGDTSVPTHHPRNPRTYARKNHGFLFLVEFSKCNFFPLSNLHGMIHCIGHKLAISNRSPHLRQQSRGSLT